MYKDRGFSVVAVNAYNEKPDMVTKYVNEQKLTHPILLMGREVAQTNYFVTAFPTTFLIDHEGKIVAREVGFDAARTAEREQKIDQLLLRRKAAAGD